MANPLSNETEIYERIKKERIRVHPLVWEMIEHHIGNDIYILQLIVGNHVSSDMQEEIPVEDAKKILARCNEVKNFLRKLKEATKEPAKKI